MDELKTKELTPLWAQYQEIKARHPEEIVFFRLGDFYEIFEDDARAAAPVLEVALTQRQGQPMCGVPHHALERYLAKLLKKGFRVAIAEQIEDPALAKGIVKRDVVRIISPGTIVEENLLEAKTHNFLLSLGVADTKQNQLGLCAMDLSTGTVILKELSASDPSGQELLLSGEIARLSPVEILLPENWATAPCLRDFPQVVVSNREIQNAHLLRPEFFRDEEWNQRAAVVCAFKRALSYTEKMNPAFLKEMRQARFVDESEIMPLMQETLEHLEVLKNSDDGSRRRTLIEFLDETSSAMGGRRLREWLTHPLTQRQKIEQRLAAVQFFYEERDLRKSISQELEGVADLERILVRIASAQTAPRDIVALKNSLERLVRIRSLFAQHEEDLDWVRRAPILAKHFQSYSDTSELIALLSKAIVPEPPIDFSQGGVIQNGYHAELEEHRRALTEGKNWLLEFEQREKDATGISNLKVSFNSVFGYFLEVTKSHLEKVPQSWHRKQTLANAERYINDELKTLENKILGAEENAKRLERQIFAEILETVRAHSGAIQTQAELIQILDVFSALAEVAEQKGLTRPELNDSDAFVLEEAWHPVVKDALPSGNFVANDVQFDAEKRIIILTGPNMSGKSTYLRQIAIVSLLAQMGSFVPAQKAQIGTVDRIFTRMGSGDRLAEGESTFMVEMQQSARILKYATKRSLIVLDEVGRGTSTYDGISIAWAMLEYLAVQVGARTLFATHYFELTHLPRKFPQIQNFNVAAKEWQDEVVFLHKIQPGPADRSYGIYVAQLAGLPQEVTTKAKTILSRLEERRKSVLKSSPKEEEQLFLFES